MARFATSLALFALPFGGLLAAEPAPMPRPVPESTVFHGKHYFSKGPCIRIGNAFAMPVINSFEVVAVEHGTLPAKYIHIRFHSDTDHLPPLASGEVYLLRLTPSPVTRAKLREIAQDGWTILTVDGDELQHVKLELVRKR